jgi:hypothetical protein
MSKYLSSDINVIDISQLSLVEVVVQIKLKPFLLPGEYDITSLNAFLFGWVAGSADSNRYAHWHQFNSYVESKYETSSTEGWAKLIKNNEGGVAIIKAFELFEEFGYILQANET